MTEGGLRAKKEEGCSGSSKRLFSPPEESQNAKRPRTVNSLAQRTESPIANNINVTRPVIEPLKKQHISNDQSERSEGQTFGLSSSRASEVVFNDNRKNTTVHNKSFNSLREQAQRQEERDKDEGASGFTVITEQKAAQRSPKEGEEGTAITAMISSDGGRGNVTSSDQGTGTGGTVVHKG